MKENNFQAQFSVNVWVGIAGDQLTGPQFLASRLKLGTIPKIFRVNSA